MQPSGSDGTIDDCLSVSSRITTAIGGRSLYVVDIDGRYLIDAGSSMTPTTTPVTPFAAPIDREKKMKS